MTPDQGPVGSLRLTTLTQAIAAALTGGALGYLVVGSFDLANQAVPITPWSLPVMFAVLAAAAFGYSLALARRVREQRESISPETGVSALVIGKTLLMSGLVVAGGHLVYALHYVGDWSIDGPRQRVIRGLVVVICGVALASAGRALERACVVDPGHDDDDPNSD